MNRAAVERIAARLGPLPEIKFETKPRSLAQRIARHVDIHADGSCWIWQGAHDTAGYGRIRHNGRLLLVHRVVYQLLVGPIRAGLQIDHLCRVPACCNPAHLEAVTPRENVRRGVAARRKASAA